MKKEKCDRCEQDWELPDNSTKIVYCYICQGMFCINCWMIQRAEENTTMLMKPTEDKKRKDEF